MNGPHNMDKNQLGPKQVNFNISNQQNKNNFRVNMGKPTEAENMYFFLFIEILHLMYYYNKYSKV